MIATKVEEITKRIWTDIDLAAKYNLVYGEETITDSVLLELPQFHNLLFFLMSYKKTI